MNWTQLNKYASECQVDADRMAYMYVTERDRVRKYVILQNYCDFNVMDTIGQLGWYNDFVLFVNKNGSELKRKLSLKEFIDYAQKYRIVSMRFNPANFSEFKNIKISPSCR